jgi:biopolymer transport protein ExbD
MRARRVRRREWQLSFASMSDIAFLLIIFFVVAGRFARTTDREVVLPSVELGERREPRDIELTVTRDSRYFVNGSRVEPDALKEEIESYLLPGMDEQGRTVVLHADRDTAFGVVAVAVDAVNRADAYLELAVRHAE